LLKKTDGSTLYILRDIVTVLHRKKVFNPDVILYVVGSEQELNFRQLFALCKKAGYSDDMLLHHVGFGLVLIDGGKMSTRKGTLVNLDEVLEQVTAKAKDILIKKGNIDFSETEIDKIAETVGTSAIIYADLKQNRNSNIEFDWDKMLSLESGSSVYLQYTYARILSILSKADSEILNSLSSEPLIFKDPSEFRLALKLAFFPEVLIRAVEQNTPHLVSIYLEELTADFNHFYSAIPILKTDEDDLKRSRLALIKAVSVVVKNALATLNIPVLTKI
jgi:arginyl-tRNA synthetase